MDEEHRRQPAPKVSSRPLRAPAAADHSRPTATDRSSTLHARGVRILRDGTVATPRPRVRQPEPIRVVRRKPPMRLPLASAPRRLHVLLIVVAMALSLCAGRLLQLQGFDSSSYTADALTRTLPLLPARGEITDRNGLVLASTQPAVAVTADPTLTAPRAAEFASVLAGHLAMSPAELMPLLTKSGTRFVYLKKKVPALTYSALAADLSERDLHGVFRESDPIRTYPNGSVGASVVGFVGADGKGLAGLERTLNSQLAGIEGKETYESAPNGSKIPLGQSSITPARNGLSFQLTLDSEVQWVAERRLADQVAKTRADSGFAIVMDVKTGQLIALANAPSYDSSRPQAAKSEDRGNRAVSRAIRARKCAEGLDFGGIDRLRHSDTVHSRCHSQPSRLGWRLDQGSLLPRGAALHDARGDRGFLQHRHRVADPAARQAEAARLPGELWPRVEDQHPTAWRVRGHHAQVGHDRRPARSGRVRASDCGDRNPGSRRHRGHRERRDLQPANSDQEGDRRRRHRSGVAASAASGGSSRRRARLRYAS